VEPDAEVVKAASEQLGLEPTTKTPLEINDADPKKGLKVAEEKLKEAGLPVTVENAFIVATCADKGILFLKGEAKVGDGNDHHECYKDFQKAHADAAFFAGLTGDGCVFFFCCFYFLFHIFHLSF
jgi:hypothetical protein